MNYDHYDNLRFADDYHLFMFYSEGPKGRLMKLVAYTLLEDISNTYNLSLGTVRVHEKGEQYIDGTETSDNGDRNKILATVAQTIYKFTDRYPDRKIYLTGFDKARTRLYQMAINHAYNELSQRFEIFGDVSKNVNERDFEPFKTGINYTGFLAKKRFL